MTRLLAVFKNREQTDPCLGYVLILVSSSPALSIKSLVALHDAFFFFFFLKALEQFIELQKLN